MRKQSLIIITLISLIVPALLVNSLPVDVISGERQLTFTIDGVESHYYVERVDKESNGYVNISWNFDSSLDIETHNIQNIIIDCVDLYDNHKNEVWTNPGVSGVGWYSGWIESNPWYVVDLNSDMRLETITFYKIRVHPVAVTFNGESIDWNDDGETITVTFPLEYSTGEDSINIYFDLDAYESGAAISKEIELKVGWNFVANPFGDNLPITQFFENDLRFLQQFK